MLNFSNLFFTLYSYILYPCFTQFHFQRLYLYQWIYQGLLNGSQFIAYRDKNERTVMVWGSMLHWMQKSLTNKQKRTSVNVQRNQRRWTCIIKNNHILIKQSDQLFHDGGPYHMETSPLISRTNQWTGFYMIGISVMKELNEYLLK